MRPVMVAAVDQGAERAVGRGGGLEAAVEQRIRNAGLLLDPVGERNISRADVADVQDEIGLERQHGLQIGGVAAPGDASHLGAAADLRQQEFALRRPIGARPAQQQLGRQRIKHDGGGRSGRKHAQNLRRHRHGAAGAIGHGRGPPPAGDEQHGRDCGQEGAAAERHHASIMHP